MTVARFGDFHHFFHYTWSKVHHQMKAIYIYVFSVHEKCNLRVTDSASLPACVLMQHMSSLPEACIDAHGCPQQRCPWFTSRPPCFEWYLNAVAQKMWSRSGKCLCSVHSGIFWNNLSISIKYIWIFGLVRLSCLLILSLTMRLTVLEGMAKISCNGVAKISGNIQ